MPTPVTVALTLTQAERAAPFGLAPPDTEPLPAVTRTGWYIDGDEWVEICGRTGRELRRRAMGEHRHA